MVSVQSSSKIVPSALSKKERLIVALDTPNMDVVKKLVKQLEGCVGMYKIGSELFTAHGWEAVDYVCQKGKAGVFLDLKFHDIPNTVSKTAVVVSEHNVFMFNVHTLGGLEMMKKTREAVDERAKLGGSRPLILGVTILTSHNEASLSEIGVQQNLEEEVLKLARLAKKAGLDGVISSPKEIGLLRKEFGEDFIIVTPGIRPKGTPKGDQKRTFTPEDAFSAGASYIVVGRPVTEALNPREVVEKMTL